MCRHKRSKTVYLIFRSFGGVAFFRHPRDLRSAFLLYSIVFCFTMASTMVNGKKSHYCLNTSTEISRLNALVRGKIVVVELAGWMHDALIKVQKDQVKPWMFHCMEGRSDKFKVALPEDKELLTSSPIDPAWIQAATAVVIQKVQELIEIVTDSGACPLARVLGILEGPFGPKEGPHAPARASRDASVQASINSNKFTLAESVPDCMVREIMREFAKRGWEYTYYYEGKGCTLASADDCAHFVICLFIVVVCCCCCFFLFLSGDVNALFSTFSPTKRKTTTEAFQRQPLILVIPSDEQALAYVRKHPVAIKQSTNLMARYASYGPKTKEAVDALVKPPIPPQASDATLPPTTLAHTGEHVRLDDEPP